MVVKRCLMAILFGGGSMVSGGAPALAQIGNNEATQDGTIGDIVVTAQRRSESLQKVPIAVAAITGEGLVKAGIEGTTQLANVTPGLSLGGERSTIAPYLRGVGSKNSAPGDESGVATYVDGVYIAALSGVNLIFNNIERIEVLKGPQGTLFGRNATGGLIQIITKKPSHETMVDGEVGYANYDTYSAKAYGTTGVSDTIAVDLAAVYVNQNEGYGRNSGNTPGVAGQEVNWKEEWGVRGSVLFEPSDVLNFRLTGDYAHRDSDIGNVRIIYPGTRTTGGFSYDGNQYGTISNLTSFGTFKQWGIALVGEWRIGEATLKSTTAYRDYQNDSRYDQDASPLALVDAILRESTKSFQQEVVLLGTMGRLDYTTGLFYFHSKAAFEPLAVRSATAALNSAIYDDVRTDSYAAFVQATYHLTDITRLTAGLRYTRDERSLNGKTIALTGHPLGEGTVIDTTENNPTRTVSPAFPDGAFSNDVAFKKLTWRLAIDHQLSRDVLLYASWSRGFKSGIFNLGGPYFPPARPETIDAYEAGFKSDLFGRTLRLNMSAFYYDYKDLQLNRLIAGASFIYNAAQARIYGLDTEAIIAPPVSMGDLQFRMGLSLLNSEYSQFRDARVYTPRAAAPFGNVETITDASGNDLVNAPPVTLNLGVNYDRPIGNLEAGFSANYLFNSGFYWDPGNREDVKQDAYGVLNMRVSLSAPDQRWRMALFMNNVTDERYFQNVTVSGIGDNAFYAPPRTYGVTLGFKLGRR